MTPDARHILVRNLILLGVCAFVLWSQFQEGPWAALNGARRLTVIIAGAAFLIGAWRVSLLLRRGL